MIVSLIIWVCNRLDIECVADVHLIPRVDISNLVKQYNKDDTEYPPAVDGLNLTMYESQITALLGHNGAGEFNCF
jgi:ABC-type polysaccharide/polyol phosphate transport system ATPase subunit